MGKTLSGKDLICEGLKNEKVGCICGCFMEGVKLKSFALENAFWRRGAIAAVALSTAVASLSR